MYREIELDTNGLDEIIVDQKNDGESMFATRIWLNHAQVQQIVMFAATIPERKSN